MTSSRTAACPQARLDMCSLKNHPCGAERGLARWAAGCRWLRHFRHIPKRRHVHSLSAARQLSQLSQTRLRLHSRLHSARPAAFAAGAAAGRAARAAAAILAVRCRRNERNTCWCFEHVDSNWRRFSNTHQPQTTAAVPTRCKQARSSTELYPVGRPRFARPEASV